MKLAFYKGRKADNPKAKPFDVAVTWWTKGKYSHCELVLNNDLSGAVCVSSSYRDDGVRFKVIDLTTGRWDVYDLLDADVTEVKLWFLLNQGKPYDVAGLFGFVLPWRTHAPTHWFCSESCAEALGIADSWQYSPNSLFQYLQQQGRLC